MFDLKRHIWTFHIDGESTSMSAFFFISTISISLSSSTTALLILDSHALSLIISQIYMQMLKCQLYAVVYYLSSEVNPQIILYLDLINKITLFLKTLIN